MADHSKLIAYLTIVVSIKLEDIGPFMASEVVDLVKAGQKDTVPSGFVDLLKAGIACNL